jgi:hypothetical protein
LLPSINCDPSAQINDESVQIVYNCVSAKAGEVATMGARMWWVSGLVTVLVPALVEAKSTSSWSPRGTRRETTVLRTLPDGRALQDDGRRAAARDPFANFDPVSEAIWGALVADPRPRSGGLREPARADGADIIDGCGSKDFPIDSPNARGTRHTHRHTQISLRDRQARGGRGGSTYDGILERMLSDAPARVEPSARVSATAEEAPWFGIAGAPRGLQRALSPHPTVDSRDATPRPALEPAPVAKELRDDGSFVEEEAARYQRVQSAIRTHASSQEVSSTASPPVAAGFPGHQSGLVDRAWGPCLHPDRL